MSSSVRFDNVERGLWKVFNDPSINPYPMDDVQVQFVNGELMVYMRGHIGPNGENPGAVVSFALPIANSLDIALLIYSGLDYEMKIDDGSASILRCFESDLKRSIAAPPNSSTNIPNVMDGSAQKDYSKGGMWQIDNNAAVWADTGFKPGPFPTNQWNKVSMRHVWNSQKHQFSFLSIKDGSSICSIPLAMQNLPLLNTNWNGTAVQLPQLCLNATGFVVAWIRNVSVIFSDLPIPS